MTANPYRTAGSAYTAQAAETAGPVQLVLMLYDGAIGAVAQAERALIDLTGNEAISVAHRELTRAQDIVTELLLSLDYDQGGEIAHRLGAIYEFCLSRLTEANVRKDPEPLGFVRTSLAELRGAWADVAANTIGQ